MSIMNIAVRAFLIGASSGIWGAATLTLARRLTWRPYRPLHLPYDVMLCTAGLACLFLVLAAVFFRRSEKVWRSAASAAPFLLLAYVALEPGILGARGPAFWVAAGLVAATLVVLVARGTQAGIPFSLYLLVVGGSLALGGLVSMPEWARALPVPLAALVLFSIGVRGPRLRTPGIDLLVPLAAGAVLLALSVGIAPGSPVPVAPHASRPERTDAPSCLLIVLDTLRIHNMSLYGYERRTTPNIDRWARRGLVFDQVTAPSSWTLPSHASLFTGLYPRSHGAIGYRSDAVKNSTYALGEKNLTLAEIAREAGWETAGIVANHYYLSPMFGVDQGFTTWWVDPPRRGTTFTPSDRLVERRHEAELRDLTWPYYRAEKITDFAISWMRDHEDTPFLLFLNYMDVHRPNDRPPGVEIPRAEGEVRIPRFAPELTRVMEGNDLPPEIETSLVNSYDRELLALDREIGRLFDWLDESGLSDEVVVILTSDHGEYFGEHHLIDHAVHLYNEAVRVPLVIGGPGVAAGRTSRPSSLVDLFATVQLVLGFETIDRRQGTSLLSPYEGPVAAEWHAAANGWLLEERFKGRFDRDWWTLQQGAWRLFEDDRDTVMLFDLAQDPREINDVAQENPDIAGALRRELAAWKESHPAVQGVPLNGGDLTQEHLEQIRALGYVD